MFYVFNLKIIKKIGNILLFFAVLIIVSRFIVIPKLFPTTYSEYVEKYSKEYNLETSLVYSVIRTESHFLPDAVSPKNAMGLMQITEQTGRWGAEEIGIKNFTIERLFEPQINIQIGCWYLNKLTIQFQEPVETALAAYNAGSGNVSKWLKDERYSDDSVSLKDIPYGETKKYVKKILITKKIYEAIY